MRHRLFLLVFLMPTPASAQKAVTYSAGVSRFRIVSHSHLEQQIEGNKQEGNFVLELLATATLTPQAPSRLRLSFVLDSIRAEGGMITPAEIGRAKGTRLSGVLGSDGQLSDLAGDSLLSGQLQNVAASTRTFFPRIPAAGAEPGKQWVDTTDTKTVGASQLTIHSINDRRVVDWTEHGGRRALRIEVRGQYTITGTGQQMGQEFTVNGTGQKLTTQYLSADGHYLGSTTRDSSSVTVALTAMGMNIPSMTVRSDTVSTIP
jgi:hypothetical protein